MLAVPMLGDCWRSFLLLASFHLTGALIEEEYAAYQYFEKTTPPGQIQQVQRYSNLTADEFEALALSGRPFVIEDGGVGQPFVGWTCDRFRKEFPNGIVKLEYVQDRQANWPMTSAWQDEKHPIPRAEKGGPQYAPWYWGVKGADDPEEARSIFSGKNPLPKVTKKMRLPPWMRDSRENRQEVLGSPEFWFSVPQAGASMHMDSHCESTLAIQLSGTRRWRIGWVPPVPDGLLYKDGTYADGAIYGKDYLAPMEAVVHEGEAFFMPSAFLHDTTNVGDTCAVSLTFQFRDPIPGAYFRSFLRHLRRTGDFHECWGLLKSLSALGQKLKKGDAPSLSQLDKDGDGRLSLKEVSSKVERGAHAFYDTNRDGFVSKEELHEGWAEWLKADQEAKGKIKKIRPKSFAYLLEGPYQPSKSDGQEL